MAIHTFSTPQGDVEIIADSKEEAFAKFQKHYELESQKQGISVMADRPGTAQYLADRAKFGAAMGMSGVSELPFEAIPNPLLKQAAKKASKFLGVPGKEQVAADIASSLKYQGYGAGSDLEQMVGAGVVSAMDPTTYAIGPGGPLTRGALGFAAGFGGEGGSLAAGTDPGTGADSAARGFGAVGGSLLHSTLSSAGRNVFVPAGRWAKRALSPEGQQSAISAAEQEATGAIQEVLREAIKLDPSLASKIQSTLQHADTFGVSLPITALVENEVIAAALRGLAARDSAFAGLYKNQFQAAKDQLTAVQHGMFGKPSKAAVTLSERTDYQTPQQRADLEAERRLAEAEAFNKGVERQATEMTQKYFPAAERAEKMSVRWQRLGDEDRAVSPAASTQYTKILQDAAEKGVGLSEQSVQELRRQAQIADSLNPFHRYPALFNLIPKVIGEGVQGMSYKDARGLQQEINKLLRSDLDGADKARLQSLKSQLEEMMYEDMPEQAQMLRDANARYAYDATLRDFAVRNIDKRTGRLDPVKANEWLADDNNNSAIRKIVAHDPVLGQLSLRQNLYEPAGKIINLLETLVKKEDILGKIKVDAWAGDQGLSPPKLVDNFFKHHTFATKLLNRFKDDPEAMRALRSYVLDDAMIKKEGEGGRLFASYMKDKVSEDSLKMLFGTGAAGYLNTINKLGDLSDKIAKHAKDAEISFNQEGIKKGWFEKKFGVPLSMVFSKLRNPIISTPQAAVELISKGMTTKQSQIFDDRLREILIDPIKLANLVKNLDAAAKSNNLEQAAKILQSSGLIFAQDAVAGAAKASIIGPYQGQKQEEGRMMLEVNGVGRGQ